MDRYGYIIKQSFLIFMILLVFLNKVNSVSSSKYTVVEDYSLRSPEHPSTLWTLEDFVTKHNIVLHPTVEGVKKTSEERDPNIDRSKRTGKALQEASDNFNSDVFSIDGRRKDTENTFDKLGVYIVETNIGRETEVKSTTLYDKIINHLGYLQDYIHEYNGIKFEDLKKDSLINEDGMESVTNHIFQDMKSGIGYVRNIFEDIFIVADKMLNRQSEHLLKKRLIPQSNMFKKTFDEAKEHHFEGSGKEVAPTIEKRSGIDDINALEESHEDFTDTARATGLFGGSNETVNITTNEELVLRTSAHHDKDREDYLAASGDIQLDCSMQINKCRNTSSIGDDVNVAGLLTINESNVPASNSTSSRTYDTKLESDMEADRKLKHKKFMNKFLVPLLVAYKLKFFALAPVLIGGLILLVGSTGLAGFFFALFAAVISIKQHHQ